VSPIGRITYYAWSRDSAGSFSQIPPTVDVYFAKVNPLGVATAGAPNPTKGQEFEIVGGESGQGVTQQAVTAQLYSGTLGGTHKLVQTISADTVSFRFTVRVKVATSFFVLAKPTSTLTGGVSPAVVAVPQRWIGLTKPKAVKHGHNRAITGRVLPRAGLTRVAIYVQPIPGAPGTLVAHAKVSSDGHFKFVVEPKKKGSYRYLAQTTKSKEYAVSTSNVVTLKAT
jgi:hypothetical protein